MIAILFPGFTRPNSALDPLAQALRLAGVEVQQPQLTRRWWPVDYMSSGRQRRVAGEIRGSCAPVILVGHSAGAAAACGVASMLDEVQGIVMVDGVDSPRHHIRRYLDSSTRPSPITALCGAPGPCNRYGALCHLLAGRGIHIENYPWMSHGAIEPPGTSVYERLCRTRVTPVEHQRALELVVRAVLRAGSDEIAT